MLLLTLTIVVALTAAWMLRAVERRETRGPDSLCDHERARRERNHLKGFPWQYDVSSRRTGHTLKERIE